MPEPEPEPESGSSPTHHEVVPIVRISLVTVAQPGGGNVSVLQAEGARSELTPGGHATGQRRTLYSYAPDGNEVGQATYHGDSWPVVSIPAGAIIDVAIGAQLRISENQNHVLLINNRPAYQYVGDANTSAATGHNKTQEWSWFAVGASHTTTTTTTTPATTTTLPAPALSWTHHRGVSCRQGFGAEEIDGKSPFQHSLTLVECQAECEAEPLCDGIVMFASQFPGTCWLNQIVNLSACTAFVDYDIWVRDDRVHTQLPDSLTPMPSESVNVYEKVPSGVGGWGGTCTCPDGRAYAVGDNWDSCGSLACIGGTPSACNRTVDPARDGMRVTCAPATTTTTTTTTKLVPGPIHDGDTIWLRAHTGRRLTVQGTSVHASWRDRGSWQALVIEKRSSKDATIHSGDEVYLRGHTGKRVAVEGTTVQAKWNHQGSWQRFVIEKKGATGSPIYPDDVIYLRAHTGNRIAVEGTIVQAKWNHQGSWQALAIESDDARDRAAQR